MRKNTECFRFRPPSLQGLKSQYPALFYVAVVHTLLLLLSSVSPLCRVSTLIFLRQTMSLGNTLLQLF
jgi:hypothetical protein